MLELGASTLGRRVEGLSGQRVERCTQCGKCTAGCPLSPDMDIQPNQIMRMVQLGVEERLLRSRSIWLCASCETCAARCPMGLSTAEVADALRQLALDGGMADTSTGIPQFHRSFLESVARHGRAHELGLVGVYKLRTRRLLDDMSLGVRMLLEGKLSPTPHRIVGRAEVARILGLGRGQEVDGDG